MWQRTLPDYPLISMAIDLYISFAINICFLLILS